MPGTLSPDAPTAATSLDAPSMFPGVRNERPVEPSFDVGPRWPVAHRILFRFSFVYFLLYFLPFPLDVIARLKMVPGLGWLGDAASVISGTWENGAPKYGLWDQGSQAMCKWVGANILNLPQSGPGSIIIQPTGAGDTMLKYVEALCFAGIAAFGALVWSVIDRKRRSYQPLFGAWHVYLRFALGAVLLGYGFAKFPPQQFQPPSPDKLFSTYGNSSMMGLLWTFMGASPAYTMFAGLAEIIGGGLLLFRRTALLGALVSIGVMLNVFMLNMCYDVPVKLYSAHLLLTAIIITLPFAHRLLCVTLLNRPTTPCNVWCPLVGGWRNWSLRGVHALSVLLILGLGCYGSYFSWKRYLNPPPEDPMLGMYRVRSLELSGKAGTDLPDSLRWRRFSLTRWNTAIIENYTDQRDYIRFAYSAEAGTLTLTPQGPNPTPYVLKCTKENDGVLKIEGDYADGPIKLSLAKIDTEKMPLRSRGFNWIQERPVNW